MKTLLIYCIYWIFRLGIAVRYRVKIKGLKDVTQAIEGKKGVLFLANHPCLMDPPILLRYFWLKFRFRMIATDYLFQNPVLHYLLNLIHTLPVPNFEASANSYKAKKTYETLNAVVDTLKRGENVLIYPSGGITKTGKEVLGGTSGVQKILQDCPDVSIVLIRTKGLWGSMFSKALTGSTPKIPDIFVKGFLKGLQNLIFFTPKRDVSIEMTLAPKDFPRAGTRREINGYLEHWFNQGEEPEPLKLVPYYFWSRKLPSAYRRLETEQIDLSTVPEKIKTEVIEEIKSLSSEDLQNVTPESHLAFDLGFDSLDIANLILFLKESYGITQINAVDLVTVADAIAFAGKVKVSEKEEGAALDVLKTKIYEADRKDGFFPEGETLQEVFLGSAKAFGKAICCQDLMAGTFSYERMLQAALILSFKLKKIETDRIGIMLPASVGVNIVILAVLLSNKVPVMINWTLGPKNLKEVVEESKITKVITSWKFLDRLDNVDFGPIDDLLLLTEDLKREVTFSDKLKALFYSKKSPKSLLKKLKLTALSPEDPCVILFTSGTEGKPKGVPLTHKNLLSNQKAAYEHVKHLKKEVFLGALPPFHSFGFSVTGLLPLFVGIPVVFSPSPLDGKALAKAIERCGVSVICLAPSFLKNLFRSATKEQLQSLVLVVTGAEKTPQELKDKLKEINPKAVLAEGYGITECSPILTINPLNDPQEGVGMPLSNVSLKIVNLETHEKTTGQGLILASGPNVFKGYLDPSLPSPFMELEGKQWYVTGDLGFFDENNHLHLSGRLKRFVKIGGEMVSLGGIEETLLDIAKTRQWELDPEHPSFAVNAEEIPGEKTRITLFTTLGISLEQVNQELKKEGLSNLVRISFVKKVDHIPLLGTGKINYRALKQ